MFRRKLAIDSSSQADKEARQIVTGCRVDKRLHQKRQDNQITDLSTRYRNSITMTKWTTKR
jgi:hypothetical protein